MPKLLSMISSGAKIWKPFPSVAAYLGGSTTLPLTACQRHCYNGFMTIRVFKYDHYGIIMIHYGFITMEARLLYRLLDHRGSEGTGAVWISRDLLVLVCIFMFIISLKLLVLISRFLVFLGQCLLV